MYTRPLELWAFFSRWEDVTAMAAVVGINDHGPEDSKYADSNDAFSTQYNFWQPQNSQQWF